MKLDSLVYSSMLAAAVALASASTQARDHRPAEPGAVYTIDNAPNANHVLAYRRGPDGALTAAGSFDTGGRGTGVGLASQGAVVLSANNRWLFACNAGSDEISVFRVTPAGLVLTDRVSSEGNHPISLTLRGNLLFALNAGGQVGGQDAVTGFLFFSGRLVSLPNSSHALSADNTNPAEVGFSPDGDVLVVTEKDTSVLDTFVVDNDGAIEEAGHFQSAGVTPFGFAFRGSDLIVSEAFGGAAEASAVSSYHLADDGELAVTSPSVPTTETSACWIAVTANGRFAYAANTGSGTISGYRIAADGELALLNADGVTGITGTGTAPADMALSVDSRFLYCRKGNGTISAFRINADGSLNALDGISGLPAGATGLAAR